MSPTICIVEDHFAGTYELIKGLCACLPEEGRDYSFVFIWLQDYTWKKVNFDEKEKIEKKEYEGKTDNAPKPLQSSPDLITIKVDKEDHPYWQGTYNTTKFETLVEKITKAIDEKKTSFLLIDLCLFMNEDGKILSERKYQTVSMFLRKKYDGKAEVYSLNDALDFTQPFVAAYQHINGSGEDGEPSVFERSRLAGSSWDGAYCSSLIERIVESIGKQDAHQRGQE